MSSAASVKMGEYGKKSREKIFWDQSNNNSVNNNNKQASGNNDDDGSYSGGMQSWEKASMHRDNHFSITDDDDDDGYHGSTTANSDQRAYNDLQEDLQMVEDETTIRSSSNKEDVANAYRDYLKSIREGGFETYLNSDDGDEELPDFNNMAFGNNEQNNNTPVVTNKKSGGGSVSLEIEEDRSLYGGLYGVRDMRAQESPYTSWRAKAQALVDYDNNSRQKRAANSQSPNRNGISRFRRNKTNSFDMERTSGGGDFEDEMLSRQREHIHYNFAPFHSSRFKRFCFCSVLMFALAIGLYHAVPHQDSIDTEASSQISIPPKTESIPNNTQQSKEKNDPNLYVPPSASNALANTLKIFDPTWFDRRSGWEGITFTDAVNFCKSKEKRVPCSYEFYCNEGPGLPPYEGVKPNGEQWAAMSNGPNQWVQVGTMDNNPSLTCMTHKQLKGRLPDWGVTGISTEHAHGAGGITQNLMCCYDANHLPADWWYFDDEDDAKEAGGEESSDAIDTGVTETAPSQDSSALGMPDNNMNNNALAEVNDAVMDAANDGNVAVVSNDIQIQQREKAIISAFQPVWFASSHGWDGTTYDAASDFCESYDHMVLCPYSAYCPNGPGSPPLSGSMVLELDGEEWAPVNGPPNSWVQLGSISGSPNSRCGLYHDLLGNRPQWGLDGSMPQIKHHVMCCLM